MSEVTDKETLMKNVIRMGVNFPSRQRFSLMLENGKLTILTVENKSKIKLKNEKFLNNQSILFSGKPTALLDIVECQNAEEYVDHILHLRRRWEIGKGHKK